jgi:hypothetical protein
MGTKQFNSFRMNRFTTLLAAIKKIVDEDRVWYKEYLKKKIPFITIGQDVWDFKQKEALGVTPFWFSPTRKKYYIFPAGLEVVQDKRAEPTANQTLKLLGLCGIKKADIYCAANDTTNTSLAIGRLLTANGEQGTCDVQKRVQPQQLMKPVGVQFIANAKSILSLIISLIQGVACQWKLTIWWGSLRPIAYCLHSLLS